MDAGREQPRVRGALSPSLSVSSMLSESMPTSVTPCVDEVARRPPCRGTAHPWRRRACRSARPSRCAASTAAPRTSRSQNTLAGMPRSPSAAMSVTWNTSARRSTSVERSSPARSVPPCVAVVRAVEVGAGVADHRDDVHGELGARRVLGAGLLAGEVRRDGRRGQTGVGDEAGVDGVAEVDRRSSLHCGGQARFPATPGAAPPRC